MLARESMQTYLTVTFSINASAFTGQVYLMTVVYIRQVDVYITRLNFILEQLKNINLFYFSK